MVEGMVSGHGFRALKQGMEAGNSLRASVEGMGSELGCREWVQGLCSELGSLHCTEAWHRLRTLLVQGMGTGHGFREHSVRAWKHAWVVGMDSGHGFRTWVQGMGTGL